MNFSKNSRLASKQDFQSVFASPHKLSSPSIRVIYLANSLSHARLGLVISKQQVRRAADRNRLRRIARESFRHHQEQLAGFDIVMVMQAGCAALSGQELRRRIDGVWLRLK